jgi:hypothetical protein
VHLERNACASLAGGPKNVALTLEAAFIILLSLALRLFERAPKELAPSYAAINNGRKVFFILYTESSRRDSF